MSDIATKPRTKTRLKTERPRLHKVILVNDDFTPREFVVQVLKAEFRMNESQAYRVMLTAHQRGVCVVAVYVRDVAETKGRGRQTRAAARAIRSCSPPSRRNSAKRHSRGPPRGG
jgi:ATP-dependent Clp protease adaptor protein ClpS